MEETLRCLLPPESTMLGEAMRYAVLSGGKRYRPLLTLAAGDCLGASPGDLLPYACSIELIHNYSLIHDDLPCMDDDDLRRGKPTCHKAFSEEIALLAGDALLTLAFEAAAEADSGGYPERKIAAIRELGRAAGTRGMIGGQYLDISRRPEDVDRACLLELIGKKTGALITASVRLGGILGGADSKRLDILTRFGENLGLAFQIRDDIKDASEDKGEGHVPRPNSVRTLGRAGAEESLALFLSEADKALAEISLSTDELEYLADFLRGTG